jgi:hypothetical protein
MAANPHKGEVSFDALSETWTLTYDTNAICDAEAELDLGISEIADLLKAGRMTVLRAVLRAGLGGAVSSKQAGTIIDEIGPIRATGLVMDAIVLAFPAAEKRARPRKGGEAGTGKGSL